jgi:hypothetical protein
MKRFDSSVSDKRKNIYNECLFNEFDRIYLPEKDLIINLLVKAFLMDNNFSTKETYIEPEHEAFEFRNG